jgi:hypothetical protein
LCIEAKRLFINTICSLKRLIKFNRFLLIFCCQSIVLTKSFPMSGRCLYFECWEAEIKIRTKKLIFFYDFFGPIFYLRFPICEIWTSTTHWKALREYNRLATKHKRNLLNLINRFNTQIILMINHFPPSPSLQYTNTFKFLMQFYFSFILTGLTNWNLHPTQKLIAPI